MEVIDSHYRYKQNVYWFNEETHTDVLTARCSSLRDVFFCGEMG